MMSQRLQFQLHLLQFFFFVRVGVIFPGFIVYFDEIGLTKQEIALLTSVFGLVMLLFNQLWGYLSDQVLGRKNVLIVSVIFSTLFFMMLKGHHDFKSIIGLWFLCCTFNSHLIQSAAGFILSFPQGGEKFYAIRGSGSFGFIFGAMGFGVAADHYGLDALFPMFFITSILALISACIVPPGQVKSKQKPVTFINIQKFFMRNRLVAIFMLMILFYQIGHSFCGQMVSLVLKNLGASKSMINFGYSIAAFAEIPIFVFANYLFRRFGVHTLMAVCIVTCLVRWVIISTTNSLELIMLTMPFHALTFGLMYICGVRFIDSHSNDEMRSSGQTLLGMVTFGLGIILGHPIMGRLSDTIGLKQIYSVSNIFLVISMTILVYLLYIEINSKQKV